MVCGTHRGGRLLVVDDDPSVGELMLATFEDEGFIARLVTTGLAALQEAQAERPSLILLDIGLPDLSGFDVCRELKSSGQTASTPVVFVSGRESEIDRVVAFEIGAADYVLKPFSPRELVLRVRAILRRTAPVATEDFIEIGPLVVDVSGYRVFVDGEQVALSRQEFRLLAALAAGKGRVFSRAELIILVWGAETEVQERTVDAHVKALRAKLRAASEVIETVRGIGYRVSRSSVVSQMSGTLHQPDTEPG